MACFGTFGSAVAWYVGDVQEIKDLQANFHNVRLRQTGHNQPSLFKTWMDVFELLAPCYKEKDVLILQLNMARQAYDAGMMNYASRKRCGCLTRIDQITMNRRCVENKQLNLPLSYIPTWYFKHFRERGLPIPDGLA